MINHLDLVLCDRPVRGPTTKQRLKVPRPASSQLQKSFAARTIAEWNSLPNSISNPAVYGKKLINFFLLHNTHTSLAACMCPVVHVCHHVTCHRRLFSLSCVRNWRFIALFTPIDFAISATPTSQRTLCTYLWDTWRQSWRCAKYSNLVSVAAFHDFPSARWPRVWSLLLTFDDGRR